MRSCSSCSLGSQISRLRQVARQVLVYFPVLNFCNGDGWKMGCEVILPRYEMKGQFTECNFYQTLSMNDTPSELGMPIKINAHNVLKKLSIGRHVYRNISVVYMKKWLSCLCVVSTIIWPQQTNQNNNIFCTLLNYFNYILDF